MGRTYSFKIPGSGVCYFSSSRDLLEICVSHTGKGVGTTSHCHLRQHGQMLGAANESGEPLTGAFFVLVNGFLHETQRRNIYSVAALLTSFLSFRGRLSAVLTHHAGCIPCVKTSLTIGGHYKRKKSKKI
jgi:hypothetical protein